MDIKQKIFENVKKQGVIQGQLQLLEQQGQQLTQELQRMGGKMELLNELFSENSGMSIEDAMNADPEFNAAIRAANEAGRKLADGTLNSPDAGETPNAEEPQEAPEPPRLLPKPPGGTTARTGNKKVPAPAGDVPEAPAEEEPQMEVIRTRKPPKIVVTDDPPTPDDDDDS